MGHDLYKSIRTALRGSDYPKPLKCINELDMRATARVRHMHVCKLTN